MGNYKIMGMGNREGEPLRRPHLRRLRGRHHYSNQQSSRIRAPRVASSAVGTDGGGEPNGQIVSIRRAADGRQKSRKIIDEEREKYRAKNGLLWNTSTNSKEATFVILINHTSAPIKKERLSPASKARREASRNEFVKKSRKPDSQKALEKLRVARIIR